MITYQKAPNGIDFQVKLDGKLVGHIRRGHWGFAYVPKGTKTMSKASFSLDVIKRSIEGK